MRFLNVDARKCRTQHQLAERVRAALVYLGIVTTFTTATLLAVPGLSDDADKVRHNGMHHCAFEYGSFAELMSTYDRLRQSGVEPVFSLDHGMTMSLYYKDPDGNFVELQSDNFSDWKLSGEYMRGSPQFAANPIGVFFDPARVYETFKSGTDFEKLEKAVYAGAFLPDPIPNIGLPG